LITIKTKVTLNCELYGHEQLIQNHMATQLKIAIIGATGNVGQRIVDEALKRGHQITAIAPSIEGATNRDNLTFIAGDSSRPEALSQILKGHDLVISSVKFTRVEPNELIEAVRLAGAKRFLVVGGAGTLEVKPGITAIQAGGIPADRMADTLAGQRFLETIRATADLDWTVLSPAAQFTAGKRTGKFRLGDDQLIVDGSGKSAISFEDFAVALLDEAEEPRHRKRRFSIGY
jgi:uncharacterized protein